MESTTNQAFSEVYDIINHMQKDIYTKIPQGFIKMLYKNRDLDYKVNIDYSKSINEQEILQETRVILSLIYRDYVCLPEKRKELLEIEQEELKKEEERLKEKYAINFEARKKEINENNNIKNTITKEEQIIEYKEPIFKRIINKILEILHIK